LLRAGRDEYIYGKAAFIQAVILGALLEEIQPTSQGEFTRLLLLWRQGEPGTLDRLFPLVYEELRWLARRQLGRGVPGGTLNTTALVHEAYLKLVDQSRVQVQDRRHFFALTARAMRQIIVDSARRRSAGKRGGGAPEAVLDEHGVAAAERSGEVRAVEEALIRLEELDPRLGKVVEMRFFAGLSVEETAEALEISPRTVKREWQKARAFLYLEMKRDAT
jgi:RNA polymerase sigma factor (TIGR02999 family)